MMENGHGHGVKSVLIAVIVVIVTAMDRKENDYIGGTRICHHCFVILVVLPLP